MRKIFSALFCVAAVFAMFSCESAEQEYKVEHYYDNIYTVNKSAVVPEFVDSFTMVTGLDQYGLQTGDRARMILRYYFDASTMRRPEITVHQLVEVIPTLPLTAKEDVDTALYTTAFNNLHYYEFIDRYTHPVWIWKNRQNINISYFGSRDNASFAMSVRGVKDGCVEFDLRAKADRVGNVTSTRLLTFDLSGVADFLTDEQKAVIAGTDSLEARIFLNREENGVVKEVEIVGGYFANPVK
jgi:hypothetical protein